jgi:hypothetical protein
VDWNRLRMGEKVAGASALALFIVMFLQWFSVSTGSARIDSLLDQQGLSATGVSAWTALGFIKIMLFLIVVATIGFVILTAAQRAPALPVAASVLVTALGALAVLLVLFRIVDQPGPNRVVNVEYGAYLGLLTCIGITVGGFLAMREEGTSFDDARAQADGLLKDKETTRPPGTTGGPAAPAADAPGGPRPGGSTPPPGAGSTGPGGTGTAGDPLGDQAGGHTPPQSGSGNLAEEPGGSRPA